MDYDDFECRLRWQKIRAIHMFTEHVVLNHSNMIIYARQLDLVRTITLAYDVIVLLTCPGFA